MASSMDSKHSRYVTGGVTDVYENRLGWWERRPMKFQDDDVIIVLDKRLANRPDLISHAVYGTPAYTWLVLQYNTIMDPIVELVVGATIRLPAPNRLK